MADITMCWQGCHKSDRCWRRCATPTTTVQSYADFKPNEAGECEYFYPFLEADKQTEEGQRLLDAIYCLHCLASFQEDCYCEPEGLMINKNTI